MEKNIKKIYSKNWNYRIFIVLQILVLIFNLFNGKNDWEYKLDLPFRMLFFIEFYTFTALCMTYVFYILGTAKYDTKDEKILKLPIFLIFLSIALLFILDISAVVKIILYNIIFMFCLIQNNNLEKGKIYSLAKVLICLCILYFIIPMLSIGLIILGLIIFRQYLYLYEELVLIIPFILIINFINLIFGYISKRYLDKREIKMISLTVIIMCFLITLVYFTIGFVYMNGVLSYITIFTFISKVFELIDFKFSNLIYFLYLISSNLIYLLGLYIKKEKI